MKRVCGWCKADIGTVGSVQCSSDAITHGICNDCMSKLLMPLSVSLRDFLESIDAPVLVVNEAGELYSANKTALLLLQKELTDIEGCSGGDVFECAFASLPEGCGKTIHCNGCTIRNTVMNTLQSGTSHLKTPAYLFRGNPESPQDIPFLISTEKVGDFVLLRVDSVGGV